MQEQTCPQPTLFTSAVSRQSNMKIVEFTAVKMCDFTAIEQRAEETSD